MISHGRSYSKGIFMEEKAARVFLLVGERQSVDRKAPVEDMCLELAKALQDRLHHVRLVKLNLLRSDGMQSFGRFRSQPPGYAAILEGAIDDCATPRQLDHDLDSIAAVQSEIGHWPGLGETMLLTASSCSTPKEEMAGASEPVRVDGTVKMMAHVRRHPSLSMDEFREHYEEIHAPLAVRHRSALLWGYRRNYVTAFHVPCRDDSAAVDDSGVPHSLTEFWFRDEDAFAMMNHMDPVLGPMIQLDERKLFDCDRVKVFLVKEHALT